MLTKHMLFVSISELPGDVFNCSRYFIDALVCVCISASLIVFFLMLNKMCPEEEMEITLNLQLCSQ